MSWLYLVECEERYKKYIGALPGNKPEKASYENGWRDAMRFVQSAAPEALRRDVPPEIFDSMAVYMELHIEKNEMIKPSMVADVLDALMRLIRKRWKAEAAESPQLRSQEEK